MVQVKPRFSTRVRKTDARGNQVDWREYEKTVFAEFKLRYPASQITWNVHLHGNLSGVKRQIDILIDVTISGAQLRTVVDAKMYNKAIDIKDVEEFLGLMADVGAHRGLMVTTIGYSPAALERAHRDLADIELDVMSLAEFKAFQAPIAVPYSGPNTVILPAPFGWVVDNASAPQFNAVLYQRGHTFKEAAQAHEWAYFQFWRKDVPDTQTTVDGVIEKQNVDLHDENPDTEIALLDVPDTVKYPARIRLAKRPHHPACEYTGVIEFPEFIFFIVLFTLPQVANRNLRKLIELLSWTRPSRVTDTRPDKTRPGTFVLRLGAKNDEEIIFFCPSSDD